MKVLFPTREMLTPSHPTAKLSSRLQTVIGATPSYRSSAVHPASACSHWIAYVISRASLGNLEENQKSQNEDAP